MNKDEERLDFFDYVYPSISRRLDDLKKENRSLHFRVTEMQAQQKELVIFWNQYKKKIQRLEQFLLERGMLNILKESG